MPINSPKTTIAIIKTGGTWEMNTILRLNCSIDYTVSVDQGYARKISQTRDISDHISFPPNQISDSDFTQIVKQVEAYFEIFNVNVVTSFSALWSSGSQHKIVVFLCDVTNFSHSLEYNSLLTALLWKFNGNEFPDGYGNGQLLESDTVGIFLTSEEDGATVADVCVAFTNSINWGPPVFLPHPDSTFLNPKRNITYQTISSVTNSNPNAIAETITHESGHSLGLEHHGIGTEEYYFGNGVWCPIMGGASPIRLLLQWSDGSYNGANNSQQKDAEKISQKAAFLKLTDNSLLSGMTGPGRSSAIYDGNSTNYLLSRRAKLVSVSDVKQILGVDTIEGMIGYPKDTDILKIILKAGTYEIGDFRHEEPTMLMMHAGLKILRSRIEVSKQSDPQIQKRTPKESDPENCWCSDDYLPEKYPTNANESCVALMSPEEEVYSRPAFSSNSFARYPSLPSLFDTQRKIEFSLNKTSLIYLRVYGDELEVPGSTGFSKYGSLGKYRVTIRKNGNDFNLNNILPQQAPPNCYATERIYCTHDEYSLDYIFFTQDPSDFSNNPPYDNSSDNPNAKKFSIVANGKIIEIPMLLQGKEYSLNETVENEDEKQIYFVKSSIDSQEKKQEFVMAPGWDY